MTICLVALNEGPDIMVDRPMVVVGRHPQCDARIDSIRVSRHHCCMTVAQGDLIVRDLGSTNGIRINGQKTQEGRLRPGDELSIAHIRYRMDVGSNPDLTVAEADADADAEDRTSAGSSAAHAAAGAAVADAIRGALAANQADLCDIQVIVRPKVPAIPAPGPGPTREPAPECLSDSHR
jgi:predicted component of type VI protein secretion system